MKNLRFLKIPMVSETNQIRTEWAITALRFIDLEWITLKNNGQRVHQPWPFALKNIFKNIYQRIYLALKSDPWPYDTPVGYSPFSTKKFYFKLKCFPGRVLPNIGLKVLNSVVKGALRVFEVPLSYIGRL